MTEDKEKLPEGWKRVRLGEVAKSEKFSIVDGPFGTQLHADEYQEDGIPVVRVVNLSYEGKFIDENMIFISEKKASLLLRSKVLPEDIIIAKTGATIGKSGLFPIKYHYGIIASSCMKLSCDKNKANSKFIHYLISWERGQKKILDGAIGSTRTTINIEPFKNICFFLPSDISEQHKIALILETVDNAIEKTDKIIEKYKRIKQGLMQDLLTRGIDENGQIRNEETHKFKNSPLGRIPEEWEVVRLGEVLEYEQPTRYIVKTENYDERSGIPVLTPGKTFILGYTDEKDGIFKDVPVIIFDDFTTESKYITFPFKVKSSALKILKLQNSKDNLYLLYNIMQIINFKPGSEHKRFWISEYSKLSIFLPPLPEQHRIASILSQIDEAIEKEQKYRQKLEKIKQGLMEDLLTGKVRVNHLIEDSKDVPQT